MVILGVGVGVGSVVILGVGVGVGSKVILGDWCRCRVSGNTGGLV